MASDASEMVELDYSLPRTIFVDESSKFDQFPGRRVVVHMLKCIWSDLCIPSSSLRRDMAPARIASPIHAETARSILAWAPLRILSHALSSSRGLCFMNQKWNNIQFKSQQDFLSC